MSDKKKRKPEKVKKLKVDKNFSAKVERQSITAYGMRALRLYGDEVNLDRATLDLIDGLKPVHRRELYAASDLPKGQYVKAARIVGDTMGRFHPHADTGIYGGLVTLVQACTPLVHGEGNWGNILAEPAAMRYTNARLSHFGRAGFDPDYANKEVTSFVPNYDDKEVEPVSIPFPLPVILFNGGSGIGYGAASNIPAFTPESVVEVLQRLLQGEKMKAEDFAKTMKPTSKWGGEFVKTKANREAWMQMFKTHKASVQFQSPLVVDTLKKTIVIGEWPNGLDPVKFVEEVRSWDETQEVYTSKGSSQFTIVVKKGYNSVQFDTYVERVQKLTRVKAPYNINVTSRKAIIKDGVVDYEVALLALSVPQLVVAWLRARLELELKSLDYRLRKQDVAIAYSKLMIFASTKLDIIIPIVRHSKQPREDLAKKLKITIEEADQILELKLRQLTTLDQDALKQKLKEQLAFKEQLLKWKAKPKKKMVTDIDEAMKAIQADRDYDKKQKTQKLVLK